MLGCVESICPEVVELSNMQVVFPTQGHAFMGERSILPGETDEMF